MANKTLQAAKTAKKDEFYTQLPDIENELKHYKDQFRGKIVYCNCDDPFESNFFKYFASNFNYLGLKKLITTSYSGSPITGKQLSLLDMEGLKPRGKQPLKIEINEVPDRTGEGAIDIKDVEYILKHDKNTTTTLKGSGDFRSPECIELLKEADIVCTNPPFSLFREYVNQLIEYKKKFLIIGNTNSLTYKEIFRLIKEDKLRTGYTNFNVGMFFVVPNDYEVFHHVDSNGNKIARVSSACWFTNLEVEKHKHDITLYKRYVSEEYPRYDNYDAINIDKYIDIPCDYDGVMGVPVTFIDKHNPDQFEIIGLGISSSGREIGVRAYRPEHKKYRKEVQKRGAVDGDLYMITDGIVDVPYARILIRNKKLNQKKEDDLDCIKKLNLNSITEI